MSFFSFVSDESPPSEPPSLSLLQLLESLQISFVDLSYFDNDTLSRMPEGPPIDRAGVRVRADVFIRNRKGKMAHEAAGKDDHIRVFLH